MAMTLDCLKGMIGLSAQVATVPSGLYVVTLPGISLFNITKIADRTEQINAQNNPDPQVVFDECEQRAILSFRNAFIAAMSKCWHLNDLDVAECLICENKDRLITSLWWWVGHEVLNERVSSNRLNRFTTIDREKAIELRAEYYERANVELENLVKGIDPNSSNCVPDDEPVRCSNTVTTVTSMP
jgi:hypothetical protein